MKETIRSKRRNRWREGARLRALDDFYRERINRTYQGSSATWGATRCPDCGIQVRPHKLGAPSSGTIVDGQGRVTGHMSFGAYPRCEEIKGCKGETIGWEEKAIKRLQRRGWG